MPPSRTHWPDHRRTPCWPRHRRRSATWERSAATCCSAPAAAIFVTQVSLATSAIPASGCPAIHGENRMLAILAGSDHCIATHPRRIWPSPWRPWMPVELTNPNGASRGVASGDPVSSPAPVTRPISKLCCQPGELIHRRFRCRRRKPGRAGSCPQRQRGPASLPVRSGPRRRWRWGSLDAAPGAEGRELRRAASAPSHGG